MKFIPFENITFRTKLSEQEVLGRLSAILEPKKVFRFGFFSNKPTKPYEGLISEQQFWIRRIIIFHNSFLPRIKGKIYRTTDETIINVKMRLNLFVLIFLCFWLGGVLEAFIAFLIDSLKYNKFNPGLLLALGMFLFAYILTMSGFNSESSKSKKDLTRIFAGQIVQNKNMC